MKYQITIDYADRYHIPGKYIIDQLREHTGVEHDRKEHIITATYADQQKAFADVVRLLDGKQNVYFFQSTNITLDASCKWGRVKLEGVTQQNQSK